MDYRMVRDYKFLIRRVHYNCNLQIKNQVNACQSMQHRKGKRIFMGYFIII